MDAVNPDDPVQGDVFYRNAADDPENSGAAIGPASGASHSQLSKVAATSADIALAATGLFQSQAGSLSLPAGALPTSGQRVALVPVEGIPTSASALVPSLWPRDLRSDTDSGDGALGSDNATDADPRAVSVPAALPAGATDEAEPKAGLAADAWQRAREACLAEESWRAERAELGTPRPGVATEDFASHTDAMAGLALAVVLAGFVGGHRAEAERRTRRSLEM
jgi:hypothetical protein